MAAYCAPPVSTFWGTPLSPCDAVARISPAKVARRPLTVFAVAPIEDRRSAEIERLARQLAQLKAQKAASEAQATAASTPVEPAPWPSEAPRAQSRPDESASSTAPMEVGDVLGRLGKHGEKSHFCGISTLDGAEYAPQILALAGRVPDVSTEEVINAPVLHSMKPELGAIAWSRAPAGYDGELVAVTCPTAMLGKPKNLVALRADVTHIAPHLDSGDIGDALVVIDRSSAAKAFDNLKFYAWDICGEVHIGWMQTSPRPDEAACLGRVVAVYVEEDKERSKAKSCWKEEDEVW
jgi:uncharacterized small protein (DUF1192 family)